MQNLSFTKHVVHLEQDKETERLVTRVANIKHKELMDKLYKRKSDAFFSGTDPDYKAIISMVDVITLAAATGVAAYYALGRVTQNVYLVSHKKLFPISL